MNARTLRIAVLLLVVFAVAVGTIAWAKGKPGGGGCKPPLIQCLDVWDPVICDDGKIYSNACYAKRACATGCVPADGGPVEY